MRTMKQVVATPGSQIFLASRSAGVKVHTYPGSVPDRLAALEPLEQGPEMLWIAHGLWMMVIRRGGTQHTHSGLSIHSSIRSSAHLFNQ